MGCTPPAPKWLLIEYPDKINQTIMRFPGVRADSLQECLRQSGEVLKMRLASAVSYSGAMQCGSDCHFSVDAGSPVCKELVKEISNRSYMAGSRRLARLIKTGQVGLVQTDFSFLDSFVSAERLVRLHGIDFLDAFQLILINNSWSNLAPPHRPLFITADSKLAQSAEKEGIQAWLCRDTPSPKC